MRTDPSNEYKYPDYDVLSRQRKDQLQMQENRETRTRARRIRTRPCKIHEERGIDLNSLPAGSLVPNIIRRRRWERFARHPAGYDPNVVRHFYAAMHPPTFLNRRTVMMGNILVRISPQDICAFYEVPYQPNLAASFGLSPNPLFLESYSGEIAGALRRNGSHHWDRRHRPLLKSDLHYDMGFLLLFIKSNLKPSTHCTAVDEHVADVLYSLQNNLPLDIGQIIWLEMLDIGHSLSRVLSFPCLITEICRNAGVEITENLTRPKGPFGSRLYAFQETAGTRREDARHANPGVDLGVPEFSSQSDDEYQDPDFDPEQPDPAFQPPQQQPGNQQYFQQPGFQQHGFHQLPPYQQPQCPFTEEAPQYLTQMFQSMQMGWTSTNERLDVVNNNMLYLNNNVQYLNQRMDWEGFPRTSEEAMGEQRRRRRRRGDAGASGSGSGHGNDED